MNFKILFSSVILVQSLWAFKVGDGAQYSVTMNKANPIDLNIYITDKKNEDIGIEYHMSIMNALVQRELWQQFVLKVSKSNGVKVQEGYIYAKELKKPQKMEQKHFENKKGIKLEQFLFSEKKELDRYKVGVEKLRIPAGNIEATHYQKKENGQTVNFWISDKAKPIGLVKLVSQSQKEKTQNYTIELKSLLTGVSATINRKEAIPLDKNGRDILED
jgi:hypothetical protein